MINSEPDSTYVSVCQSVGKIIVSLSRRVEDGSFELSRMINKLAVSDILSSYASSQNTSSVPPNLSHEILRRRAVHFVRELWYLAASKLDDGKPLRANPQHDASTSTQSLRDLLEELTRLLQVDLIGLGRVDGLAKRQVAELDRLAGIVRQRIHEIQNPAVCSQAKILLVDLNRPCGFGCNLHHLVYCFQMAYFSGRTLIISPSETPFNRWMTENLLPISDGCRIVDDIPSDTPSFSGSPSQDSARVMHCPYIGTVSDFHWLPPAVPENIAQDLFRVHGAPSVWFIGQLFAYLMRPSPSLDLLLNSTMAQYNLLNTSRSPVVGLHVRRTDKIGTEAAFHDIDEYMVYVDRQFKTWDTQKLMMSRVNEWQHDSLSTKLLSGDIRRQVFIATDDPSVLTDARTKHPAYVFYFDSNRAQAAKVTQRHEYESITGIAVDIFLLSRTDYLVCTFSSQVCRIAYELMQTRHSELGDASDLAQSLDDSYYFGGQQSNPYEAIVADLESGAKPGDFFNIAGNHWNGYALVHRDNAERILAPAYKFRPRVLAVRFNHSTVQ